VIDLLLDLDDDLYLRVKRRAERVGLSVEELIRKALLEVVGLPYEPVSIDAADASSERPVVHLDLRAP
jgi:hypothetical protein